MAAAIEIPKERRGGLTGREELQTGTSRECNNSHVQPSVQSSNLKSDDDNIASTNQANPLPCCDQTVLEEDSDNDTGSNTHHSRTDPNIEPSQCFDANLSTRSLHLDSERKWLVELESLYVSNLLTEMTLLLQRAFKDSRNCFDFVLDVIKFADVDAGKKSLAYMTLIEFETWLKLKTEGRDVQEIQQLGYWPSNNQKDLALEVVVSSKFLLFEPVKRTFKLNSADNSFLTKHVRVLIDARGKYKEAATIAYKLQLQRHFKATEILLPLIIVDKWQVAESYVEGCPTSLQLFMELINYLCSRTDDELEGVVKGTVASKPKDHKLKKKSLVKAGERLVKRFQLKAENYPNIYREKSLEALRNLLQRKYSEEKQLTRKWEYVIKSTLGDDKWLQFKLIEGLVEFHDIEEAAKWTRRYRLPLEFVDPLVKDFVESGQGASEDSEDWEAEIEGVYNDISSTPERCYRLPLSTHRIFMVDNSKSFRECAQVLCKRGREVGFDTEWRPTINCAGTDVRVSIMQLSIWNKVFILDMIALADKVEDYEMQQFAESFFANREVLKLGYGVDSDFQNLVSSCPPCRDALTRLVGFVDLRSLSKQILSQPGVKQEVSSRMHTKSAREHARVEEERGLSKLAFMCLGQPLDKTYQISDWEQRPLSKDQLIYAAADAFCLLEINEVLKQWVVELDLHVDMEPSVKLLWLQLEKEKERRSTWNQPEPSTDSNDLLPPARKGGPIPPQSLRVVVDTMLLGTGRLLRQYGIDAVLLDKKGDQERAVKVAQTENRIILTTGSRYEQLCAQVPEEMCVCVPSGKIKQQVNDLVEYLNVEVKKKDILSRCQDCNGDQFFHVSKDDMQLVVKISHGEVQPPGFEQKNCPVNLKDLTLPSGVSLQLNPPPDTESDGVAIFLCCSKCGKIFSKGRRRERIIEELLENLGSSQKQD